MRRGGGEGRSAYKDKEGDKEGEDEDLQNRRDSCKRHVGQHTSSGQPLLDTYLFCVLNVCCYCCSGVSFDGSTQGAPCPSYAKVRESWRRKSGNGGFATISKHSL